MVTIMRPVNVLKIIFFSLQSDNVARMIKNT